MADVEFTQGVNDDGDMVPGARLSRMAHLAGAAVSLALVVGVGVWGYKLMVRDVTGIPVVRALEGPMRVQPDNPGGRPADHQGLAVNTVAAQGGAAAPADRLVLAPRPVDLSDEDQPLQQVTQEVADAAEEAAGPATEVAESAAPQDAAAESQAAQIDALVARITAEAEPLTPDPTPAAVTLPAVAEDVPGVARSLRPQLRPATRASAPVVTAAVEVDLDPVQVPVGTRVVQLGAYESADLARTEWDRLAVQFGDYMQGKRRIVEEASSGGRRFFRLRAMGFDDLSDARRFCSALVAEGADCIPVVTR